MDDDDDDEGSDRQGQGQGGQGAGNQSSPSPEEEEYFRAYSDLLAAYKGQWTDVDLTGSLEPPRDLFVDVRVLRDAGEIQTEYGYVPICLPSSLGRMLTAQGDQLDQEQPVVCEAWGRGEADCAGVFGAIDLILFYSIYIELIYDYAAFPSMTPTVQVCMDRRLISAIRLFSALFLVLFSSPTLLLCQFLLCFLLLCQLPLSGQCPSPPRRRHSYNGNPRPSRRQRQSLSARQRRRYPPRARKRCRPQSNRKKRQDPEPVILPPVLQHVNRCVPISQPPLHSMKCSHLSNRAPRSRQLLVARPP